MTTTATILTQVKCPHCGNLVAVMVPAEPFGTAHTVARCDDAQDGGCDKPFAVSSEIVVQWIATPLSDDLGLTN